jgi:hypothetical protein
MRRFEISYRGKELTRLNEAAKNAACTVNQCLIGAYAATAFGVSTQKKLAIQMPFDLREQAYRETVGMFTVSLPVVVERKPAINALIEEVRHGMLRTAKYSRVPIATLKAAYGGEDYTSAVRSNILASLVIRNISAPRAAGLNLDYNYYTPEFELVPHILAFRGVSQPGVGRLQMELHVDASKIAPDAVLARFHDSIRSISQLPTST